MIRVLERIPDEGLSLLELGRHMVVDMGIRQPDVLLKRMKERGMIMIVRRDGQEWVQRVR